jgi:transposase-like protein
MSNQDARSLPGAAQTALRKRAVQAVLGGMTQAQAARVFGVHPNAVNRWIKRYRQGGWAALSQRRRGRRAGEQAALSETSSSRSSRWSAMPPRTSSGWRASCGPARWSPS